MKLICTILLASVIAAMADNWQTWQPLDGPSIDGTWGQWSRSRYLAIAEANATEHKHYGNSAPSYSVSTGVMTQVVDEITGETNTVPVPPISVPYGVLRPDGEITSPTLEEWQAWPAYEAQKAQMAFGAQVQAFLGGNEGKNLTETVQFFTLMQTYFPQIILPTTYYDARAAMNDAIEAVLDIGDMLHANRLQNQSRIIQDIYGRLLEPNGWTGIKLAQLAQAMQGGQ
jgi:hypothetical protein